jgi:hypothetical protein
MEVTSIIESFSFGRCILVVFSEARVQIALNFL